MSPRSWVGGGPSPPQIGTRLEVGSIPILKLLDVPRDPVGVRQRVERLAAVVRFGFRKLGHASLHGCGIARARAGLAQRPAYWKRSSASSPSPEVPSVSCDATPRSISSRSSSVIVFLQDM